MRKIVPILFVAAAAFSLSACNKDENKPAEAVAEQAVQHVPVPTDANDKAAWKAYLKNTLSANANLLKGSITPYYVPGGEDEAAQADRNNQLDNVKLVVARSVLPNNTLAFGGPDSAKTAELITEAFKEASPGSFKDVIVIFIGSAGDGEAVKQALAPSGATVHVIEAK